MISALFATEKMLLCQIHMLVQASWTRHTCTNDELCSKGHGIDVNKTDEKRTWPRM